METGILDSCTNYNSQHKDNMSSVNVTDNLFILVENSKHKQNYTQNKENRDTKTRKEPTD